MKQSEGVSYLIDYCSSFMIFLNDQVYSYTNLFQICFSLQKFGYFPENLKTTFGGKNGTNRAP